MSLGRTLLLRASRSAFLAAQLKRRAFVGRAVRRFMPGEELPAALDAAERLAASGLGTVLTQLGENLTSGADAEAVRDHYLGVFRDLQRRRLPAHISVKLTQLGLDVDRSVCERALAALAVAAAGTGSFLWIDMEDSHYTDVTLDIFRRARATHAGVGLCLQAYLRRTGADLDSLLPLAPAIRLVKGAYAEPADVAFPRKADVDAAYLALGERLLEHAARGARPVFGTHDVRVIARLRERAAALKLPRGTCEFHLLYGIRDAEQRRLVAEGETVRVLISYGTAWFAWYMRRLAERPANVWFVLKNSDLAERSGREADRWRTTTLPPWLERSRIPWARHDAHDGRARIGDERLARHAGAARHRAGQGDVALEHRAPAREQLPHEQVPFLVDVRSDPVRHRPLSCAHQHADVLGRRRRPQGARGVRLPEPHVVPRPRRGARPLEPQVLDAPEEILVAHRRLGVPPGEQHGLRLGGQCAERGPLGGEPAGPIERRIHVLAGALEDQVDGIGAPDPAPVRGARAAARALPAALRSRPPRRFRTGRASERPAAP